jgi:hypothetical protein
MASLSYDMIGHREHGVKIVNGGSEISKLRDRRMEFIGRLFV